MDDRRSFFGKAWAGLLGLFGIGTVQATPLRSDGFYKMIAAIESSPPPSDMVVFVIDPCDLPLPVDTERIRTGRWSSWEGPLVRGCANVAFRWPKADEAAMERLRAFLATPRCDVLTIYGRANIRPRLVTVGRGYQDVIYIDYSFVAELL